ncbi:MAG: pitrilysin family protein [Thermoplasmata archaeon]
MVSASVNRPAVTGFSLSNGLRVLLAPDADSPTASVWVWYRVGSKNEWPGITGASHWVEHMLFQGSPKYAKGETDRAVISVGGTLNAFTDADFTAYFTTVPREHLSIPLDIEADRMTRALISDVEVERERTVIYSEREGNENWPEFRVEEELYQLAFRIHPYRWDALGRRDDIARLTPEELRSYYHRFYGTRNAILVVTGGFNAPDTRRDIRQRFSGLPSGGDEATVLEREPPATGERRAALHGPGTTPYLQMGWHAPAVDDPHTPATMLLDVLLGGESRMFSAGGGWGRSAEHPSSRLYRALVDTGLAVRATSEWRPRLYPSLFTIQTQAADGIKVERLEAAIDKTIARLKATGPNRTELEDAKAKIRRGAALAYEGATRAGFRLGYFAVLGSERQEQRLLGQLLHLSARQIQGRAKELFRPDACRVVTYEPDRSQAGG